jgi:glycosyltransferase involved in cell wall biosynthesis
MSKASLDLSVIIPLYNEDESLPELAAWIEKVVLANGYQYEVIFVDDGSKDKSWEVVTKLAGNNMHFKGIRFNRNYGKSAALQKGFEAASGRVVITMDADLQDSPDEIPSLYNMIVQDGYDLVSGWKQKRYDPISKTIPTKLFNYATRKMSGIHNLHDFNCGLKAYSYNVIKSIEVYGEMHRYIPVIAKWAGFSKITEKAVEHRARKYGVTKFGLERFVNGFLDLLSIMFVSRFGKRPMHFFGLVGTLMFVAGFVLSAYLGASKLYAVSMNLPARLLTDRPSFYISLTCMIIGTQLFLAGFISELIGRNSTERNNYLIQSTANL